jgi:hypothetical protein
MTVKQTETSENQENDVQTHTEEEQLHGLDKITESGAYPGSTTEEKNSNGLEL